MWKFVHNFEPSILINFIWSYIFAKLIYWDGIVRMMIKVNEVKVEDDARDMLGSFCLYSGGRLWIKILIIIFFYVQNRFSYIFIVIKMNHIILFFIVGLDFWLCSIERGVNKLMQLVIEPWTPHVDILIIKYGVCCQKQYIDNKYYEL